MAERYLIPQIDSKGWFDIQEPFATHNKAQYTCKAIRKLSDYVSSNEDAFELVYSPVGLSLDVYEADLAKDMPIIGLQNNSGHWHYFPARALLAYPDATGVPYQRKGVHISLPPMPVARDITFLKKELEDLIRDRLGVVCGISYVDASAVQLVTEDKHQTETLARAAAANATPTKAAYIRTLESQADKMLKHIALLEAYIVSRLGPSVPGGYDINTDLGASLIRQATHPKSSTQVITPGFNFNSASIAP